MNGRTGKRRDKEEKEEIEKADVVDSSSNIDSQATSTLTWIVRPVFFFFSPYHIKPPPPPCSISLGQLTWTRNDID